MLTSTNNNKQTRIKQFSQLLNEDTLFALRERHFKVIQIRVCACCVYAATVDKLNGNKNRVHNSTSSN